MDSDAYLCNDPTVLNDCDVCILSDHRLFYLHHSTLSSYWYPPRASWNCTLGLPYAWEQAIDSAGNLYFINHITRETTYEDPRQTASKRIVQISRDLTHGYGFVAASQRPVVVQFVSPAGPSCGKLFVNDQILTVNGINVEDATKEKVVDLIQNSNQLLTLIVSQVPLSQRTDRLRRRCRVRFKERVHVSSDVSEPSDNLPIIPNVMRVFLENGQTKSFKYDQNTCVSDVLTSLAEKLRLNCTDYFSLVLETYRGSRSNRFSLLSNDQKLCEIASRPSTSNTRCLLRVVFIPQETFSLFINDPNAFEYFYQQCIADVVSGRFACEMRYEACVRLAALHLQEVAYETNCLKDGHVSVTKLEQVYGLENFLPSILLDNVRRRDLKKQLRFYLKRDTNDTNKITSSSSPLCTNDAQTLLRLKYVQIVSHLPTIGGRCFSVTFKESQTDMIMQVDANAGVLVRHPGKVNQPTISIAFELFDALTISQENDVLRTLCILLRNNYQQGLEFVLDKDEIDDLVLYIKGYYKLAIGSELLCTYCDVTSDDSSKPFAPLYRSIHTVFSSGWNYSIDCSPGEKLVNLSLEPPSYSIAVATCPEVKQQHQSLDEQDPLETGQRRKSLLKATDSLLLRQRLASPLTRFANVCRTGETERFSSSSDTEETSSRRDSGLNKSEYHRKTLAKHQNNYRTSFDFDSTNQLTSTKSSDLLNKKNDVNKILMSTPEKICLDADLIDLTASSLGDDRIHTFATRSASDMSSLSSEEHKRVRFGTTHRSQSSIPPQRPLFATSSLPSTHQDIHSLTNLNNQLLHNQLPFNVAVSLSTPTPIDSLSNQTLSINQFKPIKFKSKLTTSSPFSPLHSITSAAQATSISASSVVPNQRLHHPNNSTNPAHPLKSILTNSHTFPVIDRSMDFTLQDYAARSHSISAPSSSDDRVQVRRMSLKEFTGLEAGSIPRSTIVSLKQFNGLEEYSSHPLLSAILENTPLTKQSKTASTSLIDTYSTRRRSVIPRDLKADNTDTDTDTTTPFEHSSLDDEAIEEMNSIKISERLEGMRSRLDATMNSIPNQSPKKKVSVESEKTDLLNESRRLAGACKALVRAVNGEEERQLATITHEIVESADHLTSTTQQIIQHSNSVFSAQLMTAKTDQMLKSLIETLALVEEVRVLENASSSDAMKTLTSRSTTLAAQITQLIQAVRNL